MSATLETTNYKLPIYANQDTIAYIPDWNKAMRSIDTQMEMNAQKADGATSDTENLLNLYTTLSSEVSTLTRELNGLIPRALPDRQAAPGVRTNIIGSMNDAFATIAISIKLYADFITNGAIHFEKDATHEYVQIMSFAGNPFRQTAPVNSPLKVGHVFGGYINNGDDSLRVMAGDLRVAVENNITYFYLSMLKSYLNKECFYTSNGSINMSTSGINISTK